MQTQEDYRNWNDLGEIDERALQRLGTLCAMEASATRSYDNALAEPNLWPYRHALRAIRDSHEECLRLLEDRLRLAGGQAPSAPKISDSLLAFIEGLGVALGSSTALKAFDRGEAHGIKEYRRALDELDPASRDFVQREILPRHIGSHALISTLRKEN
jgi:hypothetical protein